MSKLNKSIIGELQSLTLKDKIDKSLSGVDINYQGRNRLYSNNLVKKGYDAHINRALFWLSSKRDDYVRESFKGGVLYDLLGILDSNTNLSYWEDTIKRRFNDEFSNDLELVMLELIMDKTRRKLTLNMIIKDVIENKTFPASTEVKI